ncbi:MAG: M50 family metallopeptidase, partial [Chloroflexota bacterium]
RLFVTYVHEAGHGLGAVLTGGRVIRFVVSADGSGLATTAGGTRSVVIAAGYLGAALFGSGLFYIANRYSRWDRLIAIFLGMFMVIFTFQFARPDESGLPVANIIGYAFGAALIAAGWYAPRVLTLLVLNVLAISTALNAVLDVWYLMGNIGATRGNISNDAVAFSREVTARLVPASVIALVWAGLAVAMFLAAVYFGIWKPLQDEMEDTYERIRTRPDRSDL